MDKIIEEFPKQIKIKLKSHIKKIILFGSRARKTHNEKTSDYDFLIVIDKREKKIEDQIAKERTLVLEKYNELIGSLIWDEQEWEDMKRYPIGVNILKDGIEM